MFCHGAARGEEEEVEELEWPGGGGDQYFPLSHFAHPGAEPTS